MMSREGSSGSGSRSRQLEEEAQRVAAGGEVRKRLKRANPLLAAEAASVDPSAEASDEVVFYDLVDDDAEGEEYNKAALKVMRRKKTAEEEDKEEDDARAVLDKSLLEVHKRGVVIRALDGHVKVNLAKFVLKQLTEDDIAQLRADKAKGVMELQVGRHWECMLWAGTSSTKHPRFVSVGPNTGNLLRHCTSHHKELLEGLERLVAETPMAEARVAIPEYVRNQRAPKGSLSRLWGRMGGVTQLGQEATALLWFLHSQIAFTNFDSPLFKAFLRSAHVDNFASSTTIVTSLLPAIYRYVVDDILAAINKCHAVFVSFDGWSRFGDKFVSQHYHVINPSTFVYHAHLLDLIPYSGPQYAEPFAGALSERRKHWLGANNKILVAGGIADAEAKGQAAGKLMFGEGDMLKCQNHRLKKVYEVAESSSGQFKLDLQVFAALASAAAMKGPAAGALWQQQRLLGLPELHFIIYNDTRWEGRFQLVARALELRDALVGNDAVLGLDVVAVQRQLVGDFLSHNYFKRLEHYLPLLDDLNKMSKFYQTQSFPTGCFVVLLSKWAEQRAVVHNRDMQAPYFLSFMDAFKGALTEYLLEPVIRDANLFLQSALLHPGVCSCVVGFLSTDVIDATFEGIINEAVQLDGEDSEEGSLLVYRGSLLKYRSLFMPKELVEEVTDWSSLNWDELSKMGTFRGYSHLGFWKDVRDGNVDSSHRLSPLLPVASMLLAVPAGEAIDEFSFSSSQRTLTKERNALLGESVEMVTVIRMFIRRNGIHPQDMMDWIQRAKAEGRKQEVHVGDRDVEEAVEAQEGAQ